MTQVGDLPSQGIFQIVCNLVAFSDCNLCTYCGMKVHVIDHAGLADETLLSRKHSVDSLCNLSYLLDEIFIKMFVHDFSQGRTKDKVAVIEYKTRCKQCSPVISRFITFSSKNGYRYSDKSRKGCNRIASVMPCISF